MSPRCAQAGQRHLAWLRCEFHDWVCVFFHQFRFALFHSMASPAPASRSLASGHINPHERALRWHGNWGIERKRLAAQNQVPHTTKRAPWTKPIHIDPGPKARATAKRGHFAEAAPSFEPQSKGPIQRDSCTLSATDCNTSRQTLGRSWSAAMRANLCGISCMRLA